MNRIRKLFIQQVWLITLYPLCGFSQNVVQINDPVPDFTLTNMQNYSKTTAELAEFKGKLMLLEFWDSHCASCIESWPNLMKLQNEFGDKIQIILVNPNESEDVVKRLIQQRKERLGVSMTLPISCDIPAIKLFFPFTTVPHVVWVGPDQVVKAITSGTEINYANIKAVLSDSLASNYSRLNKKTKIDVDFSRPLFINGNGGTGDKLCSSSMLSSYYPGLYGATQLTPKYAILSNSTVVTMLRFLYKGATNRFGALNFFPKGFVELRVKDTTKYLSKINSITQYQNYYTYQYISNRELTEKEMRDYILADLKRYFGIDWKFEKRNKLCLVLKSLNEKLYRYKDGGIKNLVADDEVNVNNITVDELLQMLAAFTPYQTSPFPFINETRYKGMLGDIHIIGNILNYKDLDKNLRRFGLQLTLEKRMVSSLVIFDQARDAVRK